MPPHAQRWKKEILRQPGRLAAVTAAALVCLLTVFGALSLSGGGDSAASGSPDAALNAGGALTSGVTDPPSGTANRATTPQVGAVPDRAGVAGADRLPPDSRPGTVARQEQQPEDPALPRGSGTGRRVVFDQSRQWVWLVRTDGAVARTYPVSGSTFDNLDTGTYAVWSRSEHATAYNSNETMRYMVRFAYGDTAPIGFHSVPALPNGKLAQPRSQLGTPRSAGCVRQWITDARALWDFAPIGTKVVVVA